MSVCLPTCERSQWTGESDALVWDFHEGNGGWLLGTAKCIEHDKYRRHRKFRLSVAGEWHGDFTSLIEIKRYLMELYGE